MLRNTAAHRDLVSRYACSRHRVLASCSSRRDSGLCISCSLADFCAYRSLAENTQCTELALGRVDPHSPARPVAGCFLSPIIAISISRTGLLSVASILIGDRMRSLKWLHRPRRESLRSIFCWWRAGSIGNVFSALLSEMARQWQSTAGKGCWAWSHLRVKGRK